MRVVVGLLPKLYLYPQLLLLLEVQLVLVLQVIAFVLVINNKVLINWFSHVGSTSSQTGIKCTVTMPHAYEKFYVVHKAIDKDISSSEGISWRAVAVNSLNLTQITYKSFYGHTNTFITIGY